MCVPWYVHDIMKLINIFFHLIKLCNERTGTLLLTIITLVETFKFAKSKQTILRMPCLCMYPENGPCMHIPWFMQ